MVTFEKMSDLQLINLYKSGNNQAFEALLHRHKNYIYSHIYAIIKDEDASNDIFQDTFVRIITCIQQNNYTDSGKFRYWATRIAHNMVMDYVRANAQSELTYIDPTEYLYLNNELHCEQPHECAIIAEQERNSMHQLYLMLPDNQRDIIRMRFFENLSFKEISDRTGVSINTSLGRMRYAILNMRRLLKERESA
ncbi:MAG: sigma-70 family RNA polymerase sigma factor [Paludibacteraceae bacterium]|nr:sigma-70 family RNA polymerase sigma factor [Paludibacteraceae bacterium]